ncbi:MAG TPA: glycosyltransferase, partial [Chloroflexota bacterium]|nr:glycosyltransferase [Chloroflexota bacterium]
DDDLAALYRGASLFLYPSFYEGFGLPPLQALAAGLPVIASRSGALPEVLGDAVYYVDPGQPQQLAQAIIHLVGHADAARDLAARGPSRAACFSWAAAARATLVGYEQAATP